MENKLDIWASEYELRQFIDMALRWNIKGVYSSRTQNNPYSVFENAVNNARENFEKFRLQLKTKLLENFQAKDIIEIDVKDRFSAMIEQYIEWYEINKKETAKFGNYNPYELMFSSIKSTQNEILKYFPEHSDYEHFLKTGRNPFTSAYISTYYDKDNFKDVKLKYDLKFDRFKKLVGKIQDVTNKNILINDTCDLMQKLSDKARTTNYKQYFINLKNKLNDLKTLPPQQNEKNIPELPETELSEKIKKHFVFFKRNCPRKHKQILIDEDFNKLIQWTIEYFENEFKVPEISEPIKVVNTNKTFVQLAFKYLFKELHKSKTYPDTLFEFYKNAFTPYSEDKKSNFSAVKNNDEVKKLMQIDY